MNPYMKKDDLVPLILAQVQDRYRFVGSRWWRYVDGYWTQHLARETLEQEIHAIREQVPQDSIQNQKLVRWSGMSYGVGYLITRCREKLFDHQLPGRQEPMS